MRDVATLTRGHRYKLYKTRARTEIRKNNYSIRIINDWNILPSTVVEAPTLNSFKSRINKY